MSKKSTSRLHARHEGESLFERSVAGVRSLPQRVENHPVKLLKQSEAALRDIVHIRQLRTMAKTETVHFNLAVRERDTVKDGALYLNRCSHTMHLHPGPRWVPGSRIEGVVKNAFNHTGCVVIGVQRKFVLVLKAERPQIVQAENVVCMRMRIEHRIDVINALAQRLHAKVGPGVDHYPVSLPGHRDGRPCPAIPRIGGGAHPAGAAERRHTHGGATTQNGDLCFMDETRSLGKLL